MNQSFIYYLVEIFCNIEIFAMVQKQILVLPVNQMLAKELWR